MTKGECFFVATLLLFIFWFFASEYETKILLDFNDSVMIEGEVAMYNLVWNKLYTEISVDGHILFLKHTPFNVWYSPDNVLGELVLVRYFRSNTVAEVQISGKVVYSFKDYLSWINYENAIYAVLIITIPSILLFLILLPHFIFGFKIGEKNSKKIR